MTGFAYPDQIRTVNPASWPQYPYDEPPTTPERSLPTYGIVHWPDVRVSVRDGTKLAADVYRPFAPEERFPALLSVSPYTRLLQTSSVQLAQNEAGVTEFWVPRGYAHVILDVRGTGDSQGSYDLLGPQEQQDVCDVIQWIAEQPWCNGNVGMMGCSYFSMTQMLVASIAPPALKAIFAYDGATDLYREFFSRGGIPQSMWFWWLGSIWALNGFGNRTPDVSGILAHLEEQIALRHPLVNEYWEERSATPRLSEIRIPTYFGCDWEFQDLHLRGAFEGWRFTKDIPKRMLIGPRPRPFRLFAAYHEEALRWYDHWLKGMDTRVLDGPPIRLYAPGDERWSAENEWPLARTEWRELYLGGPPGKPDGSLCDSPGPDASRSYDFDPHSSEVLHGRPCLTYRSEPTAHELQVTGPIALYLWATTTATDTDLHARVYDEAPDGSVRFLSRGALRGSHRELDHAKSEPWLPYHPHVRHQPLLPQSENEFALELWPTSNVFKPGHRIRLEISTSESQMTRVGLLRGGLVHLLPRPSTNTVLEGRTHRSRLLLPFIPRERLRA